MFQQTIWGKACSSSRREGLWKWTPLCQGNLLMMHGYDKNWVKCLELPWASAAKAPGPTRVINPGPDWALDSRGSLIAHKYPRAAGLKDAFCWFWLTAGQSESTSGRRRYQRWGLHRMSVFEPPSICLDKRNLMSSICDPSVHHWNLFLGL